MTSPTSSNDHTADIVRGIDSVRRPNRHRSKGANAFCPPRDRYKRAACSPLFCGEGHFYGAHS